MRAKEKVKVNVLMVDDQPAKLLTYKAILAELGENLISASSGNEALEILLKNDVAVLVTDVSMPGMDGFELADTIRQHPRFQQMAIIFVSAVCLSDPDRLRGYRTGAVDYISVPVIPEVLRAKVSVFAELHRRALQLEGLNRELRRLSNSLLAAQDDERRRIARDMHDGLGQELTAAKMVLDGFLLQGGESADSGKTLAAQDASAMIDRALQQVRSISHLLHPPLLDEVGLSSAIAWFLEGITKRSGIGTSLDLQPREFPRFSRELETTVFRIVQEALNNVFRHSGARNASVTLSHFAGLLSVTVSDDGKGISSSVAEFRPDSIGVGVGGMRQRAKEFAGSLQLENRYPGTRVLITIPTDNCIHRDSAAPPETQESPVEPTTAAARLGSVLLPEPATTPAPTLPSVSVSVAVSNDVSKISSAQFPL